MLLDVFLESKACRLCSTIGEHFSRASERGRRVELKASRETRLAQMNFYLLLRGDPGQPERRLYRSKR